MSAETPDRIPDSSLEQWESIVENDVWPIVVAAETSVREIWQQIRAESDANILTQTSFQRYLQQLEIVRKKTLDDAMALSQKYAGSHPKLSSLVRMAVHDGTKFITQLFYVKANTSQGQSLLTVPDDSPLEKALRDCAYSQQEAIALGSMVDAIHDRLTNLVISDESIDYVRIGSLPSLRLSNPHAVPVLIDVEPTLQRTALPLPDLLPVLLRELIENALVAIGPRLDGIVRVTVRLNSENEQRRSMVIRIEDNGPGLPEDIYQRVIQGNERGLTTKRGGTGNGLADIKEVFEEIQGANMQVLNTAAGATFILRIPLDARL